VVVRAEKVVRKKEKEGRCETEKVYFSKSKSKLAIIMCHTWMTTDGMCDKKMYIRFAW
jgi:hypothetical protein